MIDLSLEAKKLNIKVGQLLDLMPVPPRTFRDWCVTKPELVKMMLNSLHQDAEIASLKDSLVILSSVKTSLEVAETQNEHFKQRIIALKAQLKDKTTDLHKQADLL